MKNKITFKYEDGGNMLVLGLGIQAITKIAELKDIVLKFKAEDSYEEVLSKFKTFATNEETITFEDINGGKANIFEKRDEEEALSEEHVSISSQSTDIGDMIKYIESIEFIKNEEKTDKSFSFNKADTKKEDKDTEPDKEDDRFVPINNAIDKVVKMDGSSFSASAAIGAQEEEAKDEEEKEKEKNDAKNE